MRVPWPAARTIPARFICGRIVSAPIAVKQRFATSYCSRFRPENVKAMTAALIFDLDGTLVDTAPDLLEATNAVLKAEGRKPVDLTTLRHMVGFGAPSTIRQ